MSLRAYARHRGDSLAAVQKAIATDRVKVDAIRRDGEGRLVGVDQVLADVQWARHTDPDEALRNGKWPAAHLDNPPRAGEAAPAGLAAVGAANLVLPIDGAVDTSALPEAAPASGGGEDSRLFIESRALEKQFQAKQAELNYLERVGKLISAEAAQRAQIEVGRELRDKIEQIPVRLSSRLAAETDPMRVEHMLQSEIKAALHELSRDFTGTGAADGIGGRTPGDPAGDGRGDRAGSGAEGIGMGGPAPALI